MHIISIKSNPTRERLQQTFYVIFKESALLQNVGRFYRWQIKNFIYKVLQRYMIKKFSKLALHLWLHVKKQNDEHIPFLYPSNNFEFSSHKHVICSTMSWIHPQEEKAFSWIIRPPEAEIWFLKTWFIAFLFIFSGAFWYG